MSAVVIIGCGKAKRDCVSPAVDLYTGPLYRDRLAWARALGGPHAILSAKHGLITPETVIEPYDEMLTPDRKDALRDAVRERFCELFGQPDRVIVLASVAYVGLLPGALAGPSAWRFERPLAGMSIGQQRATCRHAVAKLKEKTHAD